MNNIVPPINSAILRNLLSQVGYSTISPEVSLGPAFELSPNTGPIMKKENISVEINEEKQVVAVSSTNINVKEEDKIVDSFIEMIKIIDNSMGIQKLKKYFYETGMSSVIASEKNPLKIFGRINKSIKTYSEFSQIFGQEVSPFGLTFFPSGGRIDDTDWFEYRILPFPLRAEQFYQVNFLCRNKDLNKVTQSILGFSSTTNKLITLIERDQD